MALIRDPIRSSMKRPYDYPYPPVVNVYKFPGVYQDYSAISAVLGETVTGIDMGLLLVGLLSTVFRHLLAPPLPGAAGAAPAGAAFIIMSADASIPGLFCACGSLLLTLEDSWP